MKNIYLLFIFFVFLFGVFYAVSSLFALSKDDIVFPVAELGNCSSKENCEVFCDGADNFDACISFAEKHNLMSLEEVETAKKIGAKEGPGGCVGRKECEKFCNNINNIRECMAFAEEHNIISKKEIEEGKKVLEALNKGVVMPGNCRAKDECESYCEDESHAEECFAFAEAAGFIPKEEIEIARKMIGKTGPGGCKGRECKDYCENPNNIEECLSFAEKNGFISKQEAETARLVGGKGPGGCKGNEECKTYCDNSDNFEECMQFAEKSGIMSKQEAEMARKIGNKFGPGGCKGKECKTYCEDEKHQEECFAFAEENGFVPKQEAETMRKNMEMLKKGGPGGCVGRKECEEFCREPEHFDECFNFAEKNNIMPEEKLRQMKGEAEREFRARFEDEFIQRKKEIMDREIGRHAEFEKDFMEGEIRNEFNPPCFGRECETYCALPLHRDECAKFFGKEDKGGTQPGEIFRKAAPGVESEFRIDPKEPRTFPSAEDIERMTQSERERIENEIMQKMQNETLPQNMPQDIYQNPPQYTPQNIFPPSDNSENIQQLQDSFEQFEQIEGETSPPSSDAGKRGFLSSIINIFLLIF